MKLKRATKNVEELPTKKPKRLDLNSNHRRVLEGVTQLPAEVIASMVVEVSAWGTGVFQPSLCREGQFFYDPYHVASFLGLSPSTVERYTDGFARIIRREGESASQFRSRKRTFTSSDTPLISQLPSPVCGVSSRSYRLLSDRVVIFVCLSTTSVRSPDRKLRDLQQSLQSMSGIIPAKARKIGPLEAVRNWDV